MIDSCFAGLFVWHIVYMNTIVQKKFYSKKLDSKKYILQKYNEQSTSHRQKLTLGIHGWPNALKAVNSCAIFGTNRSSNIPVLDIHKKVKNQNK
jgi:hypothetical protein